MTSHLYLLMNKEQSAYKIGVALDVKKRVISIGAPLSIDRSFAHEIPEDRSYRIEHKLHRILKPFNVPVYYKNGNTEWFDVVSIELVETLLRELKDELGLGRRIPLSSILNSNKRAIKIPKISKRRLDLRFTDDHNVDRYLKMLVRDTEALINSGDYCFYIQERSTQLLIERGVDTPAEEIALILKTRCMEAISLDIQATENPSVFAGGKYTNVAEEMCVDEVIYREIEASRECIRRNYMNLGTFEELVENDFRYTEDYSWYNLVPPSHVDRVTFPKAA